MSRIESVRYRCDWCKAEAPAECDGDAMPAGWDVLDGAGVCDELCADCSRLVRSAAMMLKAKREAALASIDELIARSSLGTPEAVAARESVSREVVDKVLARADELDQEALLEKMFWEFDALRKANYRDVDPSLPGPMSERDAFKRAVAGGLFLPARAGKPG